MKNVTIALDDETALWARIEAARRDVSLSRLIAELLRDQMQEARQYAVAMDHFLSTPPEPLKREGRYPSREEIHERPRFR